MSQVLAEEGKEKPMIRRPDIDKLEGLDPGLRQALERAWERYDHIGQAPNPAELARRRRDDEVARKADRMRQLELRGVPRRIAEIIANGQLEASQPLVVAQKAKATVVILAGPAGAGRSVAAAALVAEGGGNARFARAFDLVKLRADMIADRQAIRELEVAPVLAIDDLGTEAGADARYLGLLEQVIRRRLDDGSKTVITTPLPKAKFVEKYGRRLVEQIARDGVYEEIAVKFGVAQSPAQLALIRS